jgi:hypothetical protein
VVVDGADMPEEHGNRERVSPDQDHEKGTVVRTVHVMVKIPSTQGSGRSAFCSATVQDEDIPARALNVSHGILLVVFGLLGLATATTASYTRGTSGERAHAHDFSRHKDKGFVPQMLRK